MPTRRSLVGWLVALLAVGGVTVTAVPRRAQDAAPQAATPAPATAGAAAEPAPATPAAGAKEVFRKYCVTCHNQRLKTAGLMLDTVDFDHPATSAETLEKVIVKLRQA